MAFCFSAPSAFAVETAFKRSYYCNNEIFYGNQDGYQTRFNGD